MIAGVPVVHGLTGAANSEFKVRNSLAEALATVERFRPTVLWGVPSFIRRFLDEARRRGADFSAVRLVLTSGEPVPATLRAELREHLARLGAGAVQIRARYAFTEMQGGLVQCAEDAEPQNIVPDLYHLEVVEPATGRSLPDGESGMLAITHLHRRGTVLLRYLVGDIVTLSRAPCPHCGRAGERVVATPRRTGNLVKCRGMLVNTDVMLDTLSAMAEIGEFQIVFAPAAASGAMDRLVIRIERDRPTPPCARRWCARARSRVAASRGRIRRARRALRPRARDQGQARRRFACRWIDEALAIGWTPTRPARPSRLTNSASSAARSGSSPMRSATPIRSIAIPPTPRKRALPAFRRRRPAAHLPVRAARRGHALGRQGLELYRARRAGVRVFRARPSPATC